jgi:hypothetical protein
MPVQLGQGYRGPAPAPVPTGDERRHAELLAELAALRQVVAALASQPAPQVHVPAPDLSEILHALSPQAEHVPHAAEPLDYVALAEALGNAVASREVAGTDRTDEVIGELRKIGQKFGRALANSMPVVSSDISSNPTRVLGQVEVSAPVQVGNFPATQPVSGTVGLAAGTSVLQSSAVAGKAAQGRFFFGGKAINAGGALSTDRPALRIFNPAGSGKVLYIVLLSIYSDVSQQIQYREGATLPGPTAIVPRNWLAGGPASVATLEWDDIAPVDGTVLSNESRVFNTSPLPVAFPAPYRVEQGTSFTVDFRSTATQITTVNAYWYEE